MWKATVISCIVAGLATIAIFTKALFESNPDPWLDEFRAQPGWWFAAVAPYLAFAGLAFAYRRKAFISVTIFTTNLVLIFLAVPAGLKDCNRLAPTRLRSREDLGHKWLPSFNSLPSQRSQFQSAALTPYGAGQLVVAACPKLNSRRRVCRAPRDTPGLKLPDRIITHAQEYSVSISNTS
jgi:hypothetical protein